MMHDIGKVALAHGYPGLYPQILEELRGQNWQNPMSYGEETLAGGANHCVVGRILAGSWKLGDDMSRVVEHHHDPSAGHGLEQLIALSDFIAGGFIPFPNTAEYPLYRVLNGTLKPRWLRICRSSSRLTSWTIWESSSPMSSRWRNPSTPRLPSSPWKSRKASERDRRDLQAKTSIFPPRSGGSSDSAASCRRRSSRASC